MSAITKERAKDILEFGAGRIISPITDDEIRELARIALASLELERGKIRRFDLDMSGCDSCGQDCGADMVEDLDGEYVLWDEVLPHLYRHDEYTAPPAPVSVHEWTNEQCLEFLSIAFRHAEIKGDLELDDIRLGVKMVNSCRAAMLQGADGTFTNEGTRNHPEDKLAMVDHLGDANEKVDCRLPFEQWLSQQNEPVDVDCGCVTTEAFFHWLRIAYEAGNYPVVPDGYVLVPIEPTDAMIEAMYRHPLSMRGALKAAVSAAPLQEVKP